MATSRTFRVCRHLFTDGHQCGSPALRGEELCFYHRASRRPQKLQIVHGFTFFAFPEPLDLHAIQRALAELARLIAAGQIDPPRAAGLHRILATASLNLTRIDRQAAQARALDPDRQPVADFTNHPTLGSLAPEPAGAEVSGLETPVQTDLETFPQPNEDFETPAPSSVFPEPNPPQEEPGPLPDYIIPFTLPPEVENIRSRENLARHQDLHAEAYRELAEEVHQRILARRRLPEDRLDGHDLLLQENDGDFAEALERVKREYEDRQAAASRTECPIPDLPSDPFDALLDPALYACRSAPQLVTT